jgi:hypothetical protein
MIVKDMSSDEGAGFGCGAARKSRRKSKGSSRRPSSGDDPNSLTQMDTAHASSLDALQRFKSLTLDEQIALKKEKRIMKTAKMKLLLRVATIKMM